MTVTKRIFDQVTVMRNRTFDSDELIVKHTQYTVLSCLQSEGLVPKICGTQT